MKIGRNVREWRGFLQVSVAVAALFLATATTSLADWRDALNKAAQDIKGESDKLEKNLNDSLDSSDQNNLTPDQLAKQADTQLTDAQKLLTEGKAEAAIVQLKDGARSTRLLEKADPQNAALAGLNERANKLKGDLEKSTGQVVDLGPSRGVNIKVETPAPADGSAAASGSSPAASATGAVAASEKVRLDQDPKQSAAKIDAASWPGNSNGEVADAAMKYFNESADWGKRPDNPRTPLGVFVAGDWAVEKRDFLAHPMIQGLPVQVAVQEKGDKEQNLARVYSVRLCTAETTDAKAEPPFASAIMVDSWLVRADKVK